MKTEKILQIINTAYANIGSEIFEVESPNCFSTDIIDNTYSVKKEYNVKMKRLESKLIEKGLSLQSCWVVKDEKKYIHLEVIVNL